MHKNTSSGMLYSLLLGEEIFHFYAFDLWEAVFSWGKRYSKRIPLPLRDAPEHLFGEAVFSCGKRDSLAGKGIFMHKTFQNQISLGGSGQLWECSFPHIFWRITSPKQWEYRFPEEGFLCIRVQIRTDRGLQSTRVGAEGGRVSQTEI